MYSCISWCYASSNKCSGKFFFKKRTTPSYTTEKTLDASKIDLELWEAQKALPASLSAVPRSSPFPLGTIPSLCLAFWKLALTPLTTQVLGLPSPLGSVLVTFLSTFPHSYPAHPAQRRNSELPTEVGHVDAEATEPQTAFPWEARTTRQPLSIHLPCASHSSAFMASLFHTPNSMLPAGMREGEDCVWSRSVLSPAPRSVPDSVGTPQTLTGSGLLCRRPLWTLPSD